MWRAIKQVLDNYREEYGARMLWCEFAVFLVFWAVMFFLAIAFL